MANEQAEDPWSSLAAGSQACRRQGSSCNWRVEVAVCPTFGTAAPLFSSLGKPDTSWVVLHAFECLRRLFVRLAMLL